MRHTPGLSLALCALLAACSTDPVGNVDGGSGGDPGILFDLEIVTWSVPATAAAGSTLQVAYAIRNHGPAATLGYGLEIRLGLDGTDFEAASFIGGDGAVDGLGAGETAEDTVRIPLPEGLPGGAYRLWATTGPDRNAANDTVSAAFQVVGPDCTPDAFEEDDHRGAARPFTLGERREGNFCSDLHDWISFEAQAGVEYAFLVDGALLRLIVQDEGGDVVGAWDGSRAQPYRWTAPETGRYYVDLHLGSIRDVGEGSAYTLLLDRSAPDLVADGVTRYGPVSQVTAGSPVEVSVELHNRGVPLTGEVEVALRFTRDAGATGDVPWMDFTVGEAGLEEPHDYRLVYPAGLTAGTWRLALVVDAGEAVDELDEANNLWLSEPFEVQAPRCPPDVREEDDWPSLAAPISVGETASGNLCDDAVDWLAMDLSEGDDMVFAFDAPYGVELEVYEADGRTRLATAEYTRLPWTAPAAGTFLLKVSSDAPSEAAYQLAVQPVVPDLVAGTTWGPGSAVRGGLVELRVTAENAGHADAPAAWGGLFLSPDAVIDGTDTRIGTFPIPALSQYQTESPLVLGSIPATAPLGAHHLAAWLDPDDLIPEVHEDNNLGEALALTVTDPPCAPDGFEPDDVPSQASPLPVGETQQHNQCDEAIDWFSVDAVDGTTYVAALSNTDFFVSESISVFEEDGLTPAPELVSSTRGQAAFTASRDGRYLLRVGDDPEPYFGSSDTGRYDVVVTTCVPDAFEPDDDPAAAAAITPGESQSRNFCDDFESDWATFSAVAGTAYVIETSGLDAGVDTVLRLEDAGGAYVTHNDNHRNNSLASRIEWTAPASGTYRVRVSSSAHWGAASGYVLSLTAL